MVWAGWSPTNITMESGFLKSYYGQLHYGRQRMTLIEEAQSSESLVSLKERTNDQQKKVDEA